MNKNIYNIGKKINNINILALAFSIICFFIFSQGLIIFLSAFLGYSIVLYLVVYSLAMLFSIKIYMSWCIHGNAILIYFKDINGISYIVIMMVFFSFYTTGSGVVSILVEEGSADTNRSQAFVLLFVFVTTVAMAMMLRSWISPRNFLYGTLLFFGWIVLATVSISFSFAFFWDKLESRSVARDEAITALNNADSGLSRLDNAIDQAVITSELLALESVKLALREQGVPYGPDGEPISYDERGNPEKRLGYGADTCGVKTEQKEGPRSRMRSDVANELRQISATLVGVQDELGRSIFEIDASIEEIRQFKNSSDDEAEQERVKLIRQANNSLRDARQKYYFNISESSLVANAAQRFEDLGGLFSSPDAVFTSWGEPFECQDIVLASLFSQMSNLLRELPEFPVIELNDYSGSAATKEALDRFFSYYRNLLSSAFGIFNLFDRGASIDEIEVRENIKKQNYEHIEDRNKNQVIFGVEKTDRLALMLAILVDTILFIFTIVDPANKGLLTRIRTSYSNKIDLRSKINELEELVEDPYYKIISKHSITWRQSDYIVLPLNNRNKDQEIIFIFMQVLEQQKIVSRKPLLEGMMKRKFIDSVLKQRKHLEKISGEGAIVYEIKSGALQEVYLSFVHNVNT